MTKTNSKATKADINATTISDDDEMLAVLANQPEAKERQGNCDYSVACRLLMENAAKIKERFGDRVFSPKQFYAALCTKGYTGKPKFVADACWHLAGHLTPSEEKAGQKPVNVLIHVAKGQYRIA